MGRTRASIWLFAGVMAVIVIVSASVFGLHYTQSYAQCAALPKPDPCGDVAPSQIALDTIFITLFGLLAALVMAMTTGISFQGLALPDRKLARKIEQEELAYERQMALRQYQADIEAARVAAMAAHPEWYGSATASAEEQQEAQQQQQQQQQPSEVSGSDILAAAVAAAQAAEAKAEATALTFQQPISEPAIEYQLEEEKQQPETMDEARRRVLQDRLRAMAKRKPEAVAEVVSTWINQPGGSRSS